MSLWTQHEARLEQARLSIPGGPAGWHPHRLIFRDWWYWRDQELGFAHGRLGLTGPNGSGKSTLLALALPTLLDGDTSPRRLDPAESRDRQLDYYLLGEDDAEPGAFRYEARTGYLALEFRHGTSRRYLTIGMGVSASRQGRRHWWGFLVPDRRLGHDFEVRGQDGNCLGYRELARQLGPPAVVTTEPGEYRRQVNAHLFGMTDDDYRELIGMLLAARRPKLGEQRGPEEVCQRLLQSLPGILQDRLERVAEVVRNIEDYQRNREDVAHRAELVEAIDRRLQELAEALVQEAAVDYGHTLGKLGNVVGRLKEAREAHVAALGELDVLERQMAGRHTRLAEIDAELEVLMAAGEADLPGQLERARKEAERLVHRRQNVHERAGEQREHLERLADDLRRREERFRGHAQELSTQLQGLAQGARELGWSAGARALTVAAEDLRGLKVTTSPAEIRAARPDPSLEVQGRELALRYRELGQRRRELAQAEAAYRELQQTLNALRQERDALSDGENRARRQMEQAREELVEQIVRWQESCSALEVPDHILANTVEELRRLAAAPARGHAELLEPLMAAAAARRRELEMAQEKALFRQAQADCRAQEVSRRFEELARTGPVPDRSALRAAARAEGDNLGPPLFRWLRFRPGLDPEVAARAEAAALEANLLDLLLDPAQDAWVVAEPLSEGPTLLEVMEPEPGAPAPVREVLASVGWGEGPGDRWITADGRWRNGLSRGQVAPWLVEPPGLVGEERRRSFHERRLGLLEQLAAAAREEVAEAMAERERLAAAAVRLDHELNQLELLPWQQLFHSMVELATLRQHIANIQARVDRAREAAEAAMEVYRRQEQGYEAALAELPAARGLDDRELAERANKFDRLLDRLRVALEYRDLTADVEDYRERQAQLAREGEVLESLKQDAAAAEQEHAAAMARVKALEMRLSDPEIDALHRRIDALSCDRRSLMTLQEAAQQRRWQLQAEQDGHARQIAMLEPEEEALRTTQAAGLERLRKRLGSHPALEVHLRALEEEGPVAAWSRLPRPLDPEALKEGLDERRAALQYELHLHRGALGDYRPTPDARWETVTFYDDRQALSATALALRLREAEAQCEQLIAEEERQLYESIIYQGMLDELSRLIRRARQFTDDTNARLKANPLSSGEWFSLRLSLQPVETTPGAAIARTLQAVGQGTEWLSAQHREALLGQVRAEVERVRKEAQARGEELGYYEVISQALDYRRWFHYQLISHRGGSTRAITQRGFGSRSTSEKAWALAVPLIAGVAARYGTGRDDAPRMIALDEAFAGFDPANQVGYLRLLSDLGLGWIITCPDELPYNASLSAVMAYRLTLESTVHTAFPILWDGRRAREPLAEAWAEAAACGDGP